MRRFLLEEDFQEGKSVQLSPEESRHALKSLRLKGGDTILLTNGRGQEAEGRIIDTAPEGMRVEIVSVQTKAKKVSLELLQAPLKGPKMDWLVEKATELGVSAIHPALTRRTVATGEKKDRWERIVRAAVKQSGSPLIPDIHPIKDLDSAVKNLGQCARILLQPGAEKSLSQTIKECAGSTRIVLAIGPEGGFSPEEEAALLAAGFLPAALSFQVLRGETAALAALAIAAHSIDF